MRRILGFRDGKEGSSVELKVTGRNLAVAQAGCGRASLIDLC